jgi:hypothetical protein
MNRITRLLLALIALLAGACGGAASDHPASYGRPKAEPTESSRQAQWEPDELDSSYTGTPEAEPGMAPPASAAAPGPGSADAGERAAESDDTVASGRAYERSARPAPERPGLATRWGEYRDSYVSTAPFYRADPDRPFASVRIFYNDASGVRAMAARSSVSDFGDNVFAAAHRQLTVRILDGNYQPLRGTRAGGREYVIGERGQRYVIQLRNHTGNRVEAVATVDGLDVIDGRPGSLRKRGYLVNPFSTIEIEGFRRSRSAVATFRFGSVSESYAARKGNARNVGVIGVAFFDESGSRWPWTDEEVERRHDADPFPGRYAEPPPHW